jgi:hypothetical protein
LLKLSTTIISQAMICPPTKYLAPLGLSMANNVKERDYTAHSLSGSGEEAVSV